MKFRTLIVSLLAAAALLCGCQRETESLGIPSIRFTQESLTFGAQGGDAFIVVTISRDWTASTDAEWLGIQQTSGKGSSKAQEIKISALPNAAEDAYNRTASITFVVGKKLITKAYTIYQDGAAGEAPIVGPYFDYNFKKEGQGSFVIEDVKKPDELSYVWYNSSSYGMVASGYLSSNKTNYETESWFITPEVKVEGEGTNYVYFSHAGNYFNASTMKDECTFWITDASTKAGEQWKKLEIPTYFSNSGFTFVSSGDIDISEYKGKTVKFGFLYKSTAAKAGTWEIESLTLSTLKHDEAVPGESTDPGPGPGPVGDDVIFFNDFDKEEAAQTDSKWPYADAFEGWKNQTGSGAASVEYEFKSISVRANSNSDGNYSDYSGSGKNNLFFGAGSHLQVRKIALGSATNLTLSFGAEKYLTDNSLFSKDEFKVYVSNSAEGASWVSLDYAFAKGAMPEGRWDLASTTFTVPSGTSTLYIYIAPSVASAYRLDDLRLAKASAAGTAVDFTKGVDLGTNGGGDVSTDPSTEPGPAPEGVLFGNNFDKATAEKTYGSGSSYPYLDQFDGWQNTVGSGASAVEYEYKAMSARSNSNSDGSYSDYAGSGANNLFFGSDAHFQVRKIALGGATSFSLSFGSEKYTQANSLFSKDEFKVYVSDTAGGASWVSLDYSFAKGAMPEGRWDLATAYFTVPSGTQYLNIYFTASVASAYRLDDVTLASVAASATSQAVNFGQGVDLGTTAIDGQGGDPSVDPGTSTDPTPGEATVIFEESFSEGPGVFYVEDVTLPEGLETVWTHDASYHNMKATGYTDKANDAESWLIMEEPLDLSSFGSAWLTFEHTGKFFANPQEEVAVCASTNMQEWSDLTIPNWFANTDWKFVATGDVDLSEFAGQGEVYIAFVYTSTANAGGTWEIKNLKVYGSGSGSGPTPVDPSTDPGTSTDPSVD
ncbi:MAG: BACON domain-containing protein, partial [Bacteroidales bacterium]|nr:BACON domain-containing protein [Bacteroidales bacterium]